MLVGKVDGPYAQLSLSRPPARLVEHPPALFSFIVTCLARETAPLLRQQMREARGLPGKPGTT